MSLRRCRACGCTERNACVHPLLVRVCSWVDIDLCSGCVPDAVPGWTRPVMIGRPPGAPGTVIPPTMLELRRHAA